MFNPSTDDFVAEARTDYACVRFLGKAARPNCQKYILATRLWHRRTGAIEMYHFHITEVDQAAVAKASPKEVKAIIMNALREVLSDPVVYARFGILSLVPNAELAVLRSRLYGLLSQQF
jgi:hypothetical protein